jgi:hypothetical protein
MLLPLFVRPPTLRRLVDSRSILIRQFAALHLVPPTAHELRVDKARQMDERGIARVSGRGRHGKEEAKIGVEGGGGEDEVLRKEENRTRGHRTLAGAANNRAIEIPSSRMIVCTDPCRALSQERHVFHLPHFVRPRIVAGIAQYDLAMERLVRIFAKVIEMALVEAELGMKDQMGESVATATAVAATAAACLHHLRIRPSSLLSLLLLHLLPRLFSFLPCERRQAARIGFEVRASGEHESPRQVRRDVGLTGSDIMSAHRRTREHPGKPKHEPTMRIDT